MQKKEIILDKEILTNLSWNKGYGNLIQHLLYALSLASKQQGRVVIPANSILDELFLLDKYKSTDQSNDHYLYEEKSAFYSKFYFTKKIERVRNEICRFLKLTIPIKIAAERSKRQFEEETKFLYSTSNIDKILIRGHFWHYELMPPPEVFNRFIKIKPNIIGYINKNYPSIVNTNSISIHYRSTDYNHHLKEIFTKGISLDDQYYRKSLEFAKENLDIKEIHLFADDKERAVNLFKKENIILHQDLAYLDWAGLFLSKNIIQSNSTFCWTASLYNKSFSIQPKGGYNYKRNELGCIPFGFHMPFSYLIS